MKVGFDVSSTRGRKTGIGVYTENLMAALRAHAPEIKVVELDDGAEANQRTDHRIRREQTRLGALAAGAGADVLHLTGFAAPLRANVPVVLTVMDLIGALFPRSFPPAARFYWSRYLPLTVRAAARIITPSEHTRRDVVRLCGVPDERISVIPPGVSAAFTPIQDNRALAETRAALDLPERFFLFVSTLEPRKGVDTLLAAFARVAREVPHHLVIVGKGGWYHERLYAQARAEGIADRAHFLDYVPSEHMPRVYNLADAFVFPSRYEGFGLPVLEAMSCGTPVVTTNAASLPEVVGDAGIMLAPQDVEGFARAMLALARDHEQRNRLAESGLARSRGFSWERAARATTAVYQSLRDARGIAHARNS